METGGHPQAGLFRLKLAAFGAGLALGAILIGAVSLPFFLSSSNSVRAGVEIKPQAPKPPAGGAADADDFIEGNYWALIIGINKYPTMDKDKQLEAARKDAEAVSKLLVERYGFSKERMVELYDEAASRKGIIRAFSSLKRRLTDKDSLFIYYAGHGEYEAAGKGKSDKDKVDGMGYWIPSDAELDDPASYIFNSQVRDYLANIPARHIYAVVDSCFSGSLMGRTRQLGRAAIKELYQSPSRWILASGGLYPVPDVADKSKQGHSTFAWYFMKILRRNTNPYLLAKDIAEPIAISVSNDIQGQLPRSAPVLSAGDEGGQFVFRLKKEFQKGAAEASAGSQDLSALEKQLKDADDAVKKQQEEFEKKKQAMLERLKKLEEEKKRQQEDEERQLAELEKKERERIAREAKEREERLKGEGERARKLEEERVAAAKKFEQEQKEREQKAKEAELAAKKLEEERKAEETRLAAQKKEAEERAKQAELARKKAEEERKAEETRLAELKRQAEEKERQRQAELKKQEEERKKEEARLAELKRQADEKERKRQVELQRLEELRKKEEARLAAELKKREEAELARLEAERKKMDELRKKQEAEKDAARLAELKRQEEEARKVEAARRKAEEEKIAEQKRQTEERERQRQAELKKQEEERKAEEKRLAEEKRQADEKERQRLAELKKQEEERKAEETRLAELKRQADEKERQRLAELKKQEEERKKEEARLAELKAQEENKERQRQAELKRKEEERRALEAEMKAAQEREQKRLAELTQKQAAEEKRLAEERRVAEEKRKADEKRSAEERAKTESARLAEHKRQQEAAQKAEAERLAALAREAEEDKKKLAEARKKVEEAQKAAEQAAKSAPASDAPKSGNEPIVEATLRPFQAPKSKDLATLIAVPAGEFIMGSKAGDGQPDESPQRSVGLDAFTIDKYEVTVEQYAAYLKKSGAEPPDFWERVNQKEDGSRPVVGMDWLEASEFCEYFGKRLPTEAQWEKAARGTDGRKYPWGNDDPGPLFANFASGVSFSYSKSLAAVGSYESGKSPYGVYDMVGNVWEWVLDWYEKTYYQVAAPKNPSGPSGGDYKVIRGGSWSKRPAVARAAGRMYLSPSQRSNSVGFRCAGEAK